MAATYEIKNGNLVFTGTNTPAPKASDTYFTGSGVVTGRGTPIGEPVYQTVREFDQPGYEKFVKEKQAKLEKAVEEEKIRKQLQLQRDIELQKQRAKGKQFFVKAVEKKPTILQPKIEAARQRQTVGRAEFARQGRERELGAYREAKVKEVQREVVEAEPRFWSERRVLAGYSSTPSGAETGMSSKQYAESMARYAAPEQLSVVQPKVDWSRVTVGQVQASGYQDISSWRRAVESGQATPPTMVAPSGVLGASATDITLASTQTPSIKTEEPKPLTLKEQIAQGEFWAALARGETQTAQQIASSNVEAIKKLQPLMYQRETYEAPKLGAYKPDFKPIKESTIPELLAEGQWVTAAQIAKQQLKQEPDKEVYGTDLGKLAASAGISFIEPALSIGQTITVLGAPILGLSKPTFTLYAGGKETKVLGTTETKQMFKDVGKSFLKSPESFARQMVTTTIEDYKANPTDFVSSQAGSYFLFKGIGTTIYKPLKLVGSNIKNITISKFKGIEQGFIFKSKLSPVMDVPFVKYKRLGNKQIGFVEDIHANLIAGDISLSGLKTGSKKLFQTRTFPEFPSIKGLEVGENVLAVQSPLGARWGLPVRGQTYFQPFKEMYLSARQFGSESFNKMAQTYERIGFSIFPKTQKTYLFLGEGKSVFTKGIKAGKTPVLKAKAVLKLSEFGKSGKFNIPAENILKIAEERQTALTSQGVLSSGQKVAGSTIKLKERLPTVRFYDVKKLPLGLSKFEGLQSIYEKSGLGRVWRKAEPFIVEPGRPRGRPPIITKVGQRIRPTAIVKEGEKYLLVQERTGQYGLLGGGQDYVFNPNYYKGSKIGLRGGRWVPEGITTTIEREAGEEIGVSLKGFKKISVGEIKSKPYVSNEGFVQQEVFKVYEANINKLKSAGFYAKQAKGFKSGEILGTKYFTKEELLSMPAEKLTGGTKEILNRYFGVLPKKKIITPGLEATSRLKTLKIIEGERVMAQLDYWKIINGKPNEIVLGNVMAFEQGKGYGRKLIELARQKFPEKELTIYTAIPSSRGFFKKVGFIEKEYLPGHPIYTIKGVKSMQKNIAEVELSPRELIRSVKPSDRVVKEYVKDVANIKYVSVVGGIRKVAPFVELPKIRKEKIGITKKSYVPKVKEPKYEVPSYKPSDYKPSYQPSYEPTTYVSSYVPSYKSPIYKSPEIPTYKIPTYTPPELPTYKIPPYEPTYIPPYTPLYKTPPYKPPYTPTYTPPYKPPTTPPPTITRTRYSKPIKQFSRIERQATQAFDVFVRKQGKLKLVAKGLPERLATLKGLQTVEKYTQRTAVLRKVGYTTIRDIPEISKRFEARFREPTQKSSLRKLGDKVLIEKSLAAISSYEEKLGIPYKAMRLKKQKTFLKNLTQY
ncbi:MAG: hypothetical protein H7836_10735 [Magnetococcus sp. YQC-3]